MWWSSTTSTKTSDSTTSCTRSWFGFLGWRFRQFWWKLSRAKNHHWRSQGKVSRVETVEIRLIYFLVTHNSLIQWDGLLICSRMTLVQIGEVKQQQLLFNSPVSRPWRNHMNQEKFKNYINNNIIFFINMIYLALLYYLSFGWVSHSYLGSTPKDPTSGSKQ